MDNDDSEHLESLHFLSLEVQPKTYRERGWGTATVIGEADSRERLSGLLLLNGKAGGGGWALTNPFVPTLGACLRLLDVRLLHFHARAAFVR